MTESLHPVPRERRVVVTRLDQRYLERHPDISLERYLAHRGFDMALPYREEPWEWDGTLYVQDIPQGEA